MNLSSEDAATLLTFVSAVVIPFAVIWLQNVRWSSQAKFALAAVLSLVAGALTAYVAGEIVLSGSLIQNASVIFSAAQVIYFAAFRALGLERVLFPQEALVNQAKEQAVQETADVSKDTAKAVLSSDSTTTLDVQVNVVGS